MKVRNCLDQFILPKPQIDQTFAHSGAFGVHQTFLDKLRQAGDCRFRLFRSPPQLVQVPWASVPPLFSQTRA